MQVSKCMVLVLVTLGNPLTLHFIKCFLKFFGALLLCPLLKGQTNEVQLRLTVLIKDRPSWAIERSCFTVTNVKKKPRRSPLAAFAHWRSPNPGCQTPSTP